MNQHIQYQLLLQLIKEVDFLGSERGHTRTQITEKTGLNFGNFSTVLGLGPEDKLPLKKTLERYLAKLENAYGKELRILRKRKRSIRSDVTATSEGSSFISQDFGLRSAMKKIKALQKENNSIKQELAEIRRDYAEIRKDQAENRRAQAENKDKLLEVTRLIEEIKKS